jgi:signal transduction histidine kinase
MWSPDPNVLSLRARLGLMLLVGLGATMAAGFYGLHKLIRHEIYSASWERLDNRREAISDFAAGHAGGEGAIEEVLEFGTGAHADFFEVRDAQGRLLARSRSSAGRDLGPPATASGTAAGRYSLVLPDGHAGIASSGVRALPSGDPRGHLATTVAVEIVPLDRLRQRIHAAMLVVGVATMLAALAITALAIRRGLAPVDRLAASAAGIDPEGPRQELEVGRLPAELSVMGAKLAALLRQLFDARDRERRFTRSVAHKLRTPLAELRMLAEVGALGSGEAEARSALREIEATSEELQRVLEALLTLARCEAGHEQPQTEPVDLGALTRAALERTAGLFRERGITTQLSIPHESWAMTDAALLRQLLLNLLGNAAAHAPRGTEVTIELAPGPVLRIVNVAPQLRSEDLRRLGERFFTIDSGNGGHHVGLGLSLAGEIARVMRLNLGLELAAGQRFIASVGEFNGLPSLPRDA